MDIPVPFTTLRQVFHVGDIHVRKLQRHDEYRQVFSRLYDKLRNEDIEDSIIYVGGDIFHNKSLIHSVAQSVLLDLVRNYRSINFIFLSGNHDMSNMVGDGVSATKSFDNEKNVTTIHETCQIENILFVPWNPRTMIIDLKNGTAEYAISHLGLNEGVLNSGISLVSDIGLKDLKQYKTVFLGHYHTYQKVGNVEYIGSLIHLDWNDKNQEKRFIEFNSDTGEERSIPSTGYKKHCEFDLTSENKDEILKTINQLKSEGHHIKLNKTDGLDTSKIEEEFTVIDKREKDITNRGITSGMSISDKLNRFLEIKEIPIEKRDAYRNSALNIIESVSI